MFRFSSCAFCGGTESLLVYSCVPVPKTVKQYLEKQELNKYFGGMNGLLNWIISMASVSKV